MAARRVVVVGGGITGLTTAYRLARAGRDASGAPIQITLLEERPRLGGNIQTERQNGFVLDGGPDAFVSARPDATALCRELGLEGRLIGTNERNRKVYIRQDGELHPLPEGLVLAVPTRVLPLARSRLFSWSAKARMGLDLLLPRHKGDEDESVGHFIRRRLGSEALERLAEPLLGGIYAGNIDALSLKATFPQLLDLERKHGSLIRGAIAQRAAQKGKASSGSGSVFTSLLGGMGELVSALGAAIEKAGGDIRVGARASSIATATGSGRLIVEVDVHGERSLVEAEDVVVSTPAFVAADALAGLDPALAAGLREIPYVSTATVILGFPRADVPHPLDASGLIIPKGEGRRALAATFVSSKWVGRAPSDVALLRIFVGGHRDPTALEQTDEQLVAMARSELEALVGVKARPVLARVFRYERSNAQPVVGHAARVARLKALAAGHPGLHLAGAAYDGVGIPDCVRQANEAAAAIAAQR